MANVLRQGDLLCSRTALIQFQRYRGKINIQRPRAPHYERALVNALTQPKYKERPKSLTCFKTPAERFNLKESNPYVDILGKEVYNWFEHSKLVAVFHLNSISSDDIFRLRVLLHKQDMHLKSYGKDVIAKAIKDTRYAAIEPLFESKNCIVFAAEQKLTTLLRLTRKVPQMILLGGIVEQTLLSRNELLAFAQMPNIQAAQAELVQTLNMAAGNLAQQLEAHQKSLVQILDVHAKGECNAVTGTQTETEIETEKP